MISPRYTTLKAGYVAFGTQFYEPARLNEISARAENQLAEAGLELVSAGAVYGESTESERAIALLHAQEWDFLFVNIVNWIDTRGVFRVLHEFRHQPMILYSLGGFTEGDTLISPAAGAGSTSVRYPMEQWGIKFKYLFNAHDCPMDIPAIMSFAKAANVAKRLKYARLGMVGWGDMGLYSTGYNPTRLRNELGPEIESIDLLQLERKMQSLHTTEVEEEIKKVTKDWEYPLGKPEAAVIKRAIEMYLATYKICMEKGFDAFSYKCVDGIDLEMNATHAIPSSLLASKGIPYIDENDMVNLTAELALKWLTGKTASFLEHYEHHPEWILLGEDGYIPNDYIQGNPQIKAVATVLLGGIAHCSTLIPGRMTLACLSEDKEGYRMHIVSGVGKPNPQWVEMGVPLPSWPSVKFYPDASVRSILDHVQSQHFACVYGDHVEELIDLCNLLNIKVVLDTKT